MVEQQLHGAHHLLADGVQQGVAHVHVEAQHQLDDLQVLVLDGDQQRCAAQRVDAVDVDLKVDLRLLETGRRPSVKPGIFRPSEPEIAVDPS